MQKNDTKLRIVEEEPNSHEQDSKEAPMGDDYTNSNILLRPRPSENKKDSQKNTLKELKTDDEIVGQRFGHESLLIDPNED